MKNNSLVIKITNNEKDFIWRDEFWGYQIKNTNIIVRALYYEKEIKFAFFILNKTNNKSSSEISINDILNDLPKHIQDLFVQHINLL